MSDHLQTSRAPGPSTAKRSLAIDTPLGPDVVTLLSLDGEDVLSRCFLYRIAVVTEQTDSAVQALLGMPVTLWLSNDDAERRRPIHGHVRRVVGQDQDVHGNRQYLMEIVPRLWFLSCTVDCRIFQNLSVPDILRTIFHDHGLTDAEFRMITSDYKPVEYCVQYQESALDFVSRLMEHLGLFYWHEHSADKHVLVISDRNTAAPLNDPPNLSVSNRDGPRALWSLNIDYSFRPGKWTLNDYDFESPTKRLLVHTPTTLKVPRMVDHEIYEYPGNFTDQNSGRHLARLRMEMEEAWHHRVFGTGSCAGFDPGRRVTIAVAHGERETSYLLTEVRHHATSAGLEANDGKGPTYSNEYVAIRTDIPFRPERVTERPVIRGSQTATVVGPAGENIHCDRYGRVRVQFHWDRRGQRNEQSSCWMRVAQARAGSNYGSLSIPHVGHEVIVSFIDGNPDRPLITGTVPNALTMPPVPLPADKDKTIQRDHGDNKIVMQGKAGQQHLSMVSPRTINLFSGRGPAKSLSASGSPPSGYDTIGGNLIPAYQDQDGLDSIQNNWAALAQAGASAGNDANDINTATVGRINSLSLGNTNEWAMGNINSWMAGDSNTRIFGDSNSTVSGSVTTTIYSGSDTTVYGTNVTSVTGDNSSFVFGLNTTMVLGANITISAPLTAAISPGFMFQLNGFNVQNNGFNVSTNSIKVKTTDGVDISTANLSLGMSLLHLFG